MKKEIIDGIMEKELIKSMGCTEPAAIAYGVAFAKEQFQHIDDIKTVDVYLSPNMLKNALSVTIPNTNICGFEAIVLLSLLYGESKDKLEIFKHVDDKAIENLTSSLSKFKIDVHPVQSENTMYIEVLMQGKGKKVQTVMIQDHDSIKRLCINDDVIIENSVSDEEEDSIANVNYEDIFEYVMNDQYDLELVKDIIKCDAGIVKYGETHSVGLNTGKGIQNIPIYAAPFAGVISKTLSAVDSRMSGAPASVYINNGSGNQGITVTVPVIEMAKVLNVSDEKMYRAIMLSYLTAVYIKSKQNKLSSICGAVIAAAGASAGIAYMLDCNEDEIKRASLMTLCSNFGLFCDGAKETCSFKVMSSVSSAINSAYLSKQGIYINKNMGIMSTDFDESLDNIAQIEREFTDKMDNCIMSTAINTVKVKKNEIGG